MTLPLIQLFIESLLKKSIYIRQRGLVRPKFFLLRDGAIALGDSLAPVPSHIRVNLEVEDISVLVHPRQREVLRILERCYKKRNSSSAA